MPNWTSAQLDAINSRNGTVLVSAAAGSGKTAVLVQRVIERLTDNENPTSADKLLVVTFTKAAAAEMRGRIEIAIIEKIHENPTDTRLIRQQILLSQANISTVDSFCSKIAREFFEKLDISPEFKIVADKQKEDLQHEAMEEVLDELFAMENHDIADIFSSERDDNRLTTTILSMYNFTRSHLYPDQWLDDKTAYYNNEIPVKETIWGSLMVENAKESLQFCRILLTNAQKALPEDEKLQASLSGVFQGDLNTVENLLDTLENKSWDDFKCALEQVKFPTFSTPKSYKEDLLKLKLEALRNQSKDEITKNLKIVFSESESQVKDDIKDTLPVAKELSRLVKRFSQIYDQKKHDKNLADYNDIEHFAVRLFIEQDENKCIKRTALAKEVSSRFDEIMIDEYQDTNEVQDSIFKAISKDDTNRFMVGDVKQSIYSFRQAMPDIFIKYKKSFSKFQRESPTYPGTIILDKNFRSSEEVINSVNFVFQGLMSEKSGGVDYENEEKLVNGLELPENKGRETIVDFIKADKNLSSDIVEARHISNLIKEMIENGQTIMDKGQERKVSYKDFCILIRSANKLAFNYADEMVKEGVPTWASISGSFFNSAEILGVMSFLQVIDNPNQDIPMLSILMSPVYGFSPEEIASVRLENKDVSLYIAMLQSGNEKFAKVMDDLEEYRLLAATMPSNVFVNFLYQKTGYLDLVLAMENGESRLANLRRLEQYAGDYEKAGYIGVSGFVGFMDKLKASKSDMESATVISENADVVRIMSIHKSKGLEFPVCIVAACGKKFNFDKEEVVFNSELGLGIKIKDMETGARYGNIIRDAVYQKNKLNDISEELRVLYVAMTRAREKLIMVSTVKNIESNLNKFAAQISNSKKITEYTVNCVTSISQWLMISALRHPSGNILRNLAQCDDQCVVMDNFTPWQIRVVNPIIETSEKAEEEKIVPLVDKVLLQKIKNNCDFIYDNQEENLIPAKITVTAMAGELKETSLSRPSFLSYKGLTPAERGTALHNYMQFADFGKAVNNPEMELKRLVDNGFITKEQGEVVNLKKVKKFLQSDIGIRISKSKDVKKEYRFSTSIPAIMVNPLLSDKYKDIPVILQGAVDCLFVEDGKIYIVDFKTDRTSSPEELVESYQMQLLLYAKALRDISGMEIGGCYLYSLTMDKSCPVEL